MNGARRVAGAVRIAVVPALAVIAIPFGVAAAPLAARTEPLPIVDRDFELDAQDVFDVTVQLPGGLDSATLGSDGTAVELDVVAYGALTDRKDVARIRAGRSVAAMRQPEDTFTVTLDASVADAHVTARPASDQVTVAVPVEAVDSEVGLQLPREGVYPIGIALRVGRSTVSETITFVHRRSAGESTIADLPIAMLMAQTAPPSVTEDGSLLLSSEELVDLTTLTESLEAMDAVATATDAGAPTIPRGALVQPASLQALAELDPGLAERLVAVLSRSEVMAAPKLPLDPSSIVAAARDQLYTDWLRAGEDVVSAIVAGSRTDRSLHLATGPVSAAGARYLAGIGVDAIVMNPALYAATEGSIDDFGDPTWLQTIELDDGSTVPVLRIDPYIGDRLDDHPTDPAAAAVDLMAEVLTYREYLDSIGRAVPHTGLLLAGTEGGAIDPAFAAEIARLLVQIDGVDVVSPGDLIAGMGSQPVDGTLGTLDVPAVAGEDLTSRFATIDVVTFESAAIGSMLPDDDGHIVQWRSLIETMPSSSLSDEAVERMAASLKASYDEFKNGVQGPEPFKFTLTGRTGTIRFRLVNATDVTLEVMVHLDGAKLTFPVNDQVYEIPPNGFVPVAADTESRSNGTSQVIVRLLTPTGSQIGSDIVLTAQVRALTGLGQLLTGACLMILATWWVRHWRLSRRRQATAVTSDRHPAVRGRRRPHIAEDATPGGEPADVVEADQLDEPPRVEVPAAPPDTPVDEPPVDPGDEPRAADVLAPDAAASSLPPS